MLFPSLLLLVVLVPFRFVLFGFNFVFVGLGFPFLALLQFFSVKSIDLGTFKQ